MLTDRDEKSNLYKGPSIDVSYQVSVDLTKRCQGRIFFKLTNQKKVLPVGGHVFLTDRDEMYKQRSTKHYTENKGSSNTNSTKHRG